MATQTGISIAGPNEPYTIVEDITQPTPGPGQALVKTLYVGINPVDPIMQHTGLLIESFPAVTGSDFIGVVLTTGLNTSKLSPGNIVFGCAPIGLNQFSPFQESFLVNENWIFKYSDVLKQKGMKLEQGPTVGAGLVTAALGLVGGLKLSLNLGEKNEKDEWVVVMGGSGTVGQYAVQIARLAGYKVLASCSPSKAEIAKEAGAHATFDNRAPIDEQLGMIERITGGGGFTRVFDASAQAPQVSLRALDEISKIGQSGGEKEKYFSTVDDWSQLEIPKGITAYRVQFGQLGKTSTPLGQGITDQVEEMIPLLQKHLESGTIKPLDTYTVVDGQGWDKVVNALSGFEAGTYQGRKPVIKVADAEGL
ncbi:hypothetical protein V8F20_009864 [Naviculisporaceae sp. PSN 640]